MKKYSEDKAVDKASDDKFEHLNLAKQIAEIIVGQTADHPVNIGLFGKWGSGKIFCCGAVGGKRTGGENRQQ